MTASVGPRPAQIPRIPCPKPGLPTARLAPARPSTGEPTAEARISRASASMERPCCAARTRSRCLIGSARCLMVRVVPAMRSAKAMTALLSIAHPPDSHVSTSALAEWVSAGRQSVGRSRLAASTGCRHSEDGRTGRRSNGARAFLPALPFDWRTGMSALRFLSSRRLGRHGPRRNIQCPRRIPKEDAPSGRPEYSPGSGDPPPGRRHPGSQHPQTSRTPDRVRSTSPSWRFADAGICAGIQGSPIRRRECGCPMVGPPMVGGWLVCPESA